MRPLVTLVVLAVAATGLEAQAREHAPLVLELPANTRALGMGGAFAIGSADADAIFYNPAMSAAAGVSLGLQRYGGSGTVVSLAGGTEWWGGRIGVGLQTASYAVTASQLEDGFDEGALVNDATEEVAENVASVSYARRVFGLRVGVTGKYIDQRAGDTHAATGALDLSTGVSISRFNLGLAVQNIGLEDDLAGAEVRPPLRITLGGAVAQSIPIGPLDLSAAAAVSREADGTVVPGAGVELGYWPIQGRTFFARAGLRDPASGDVAPWTFGAGFNGDRITLDWSTYEVDRSLVHRLSLRWR